MEALWDLWTLFPCDGEAAVEKTSSQLAHASHIPERHTGLVWPPWARPEQLPGLHTPSSRGEVPRNP